MDTKYQTLFACLCTILADIKLDELIDYMRRLGCNFDSVTLVTAVGPKHVGIWEATELMHKNTICKNTLCTFYGGPPTQFRIYSGSLLTVLVDRLLTAGVVDKDTKILDNLMQDTVPF
jgi:hypothetical protein